MLVAAWIVAVSGDGAWVSAPLLVLFPVLIQLGFVFIGGQAGRILDIAGIKANFPRIVAGFPVGAVIGGVVAGPLLTLFGRAEDLLLATATAQAAFLGLLLLTGRWFAVELPGCHLAVARRPRAPAALAAAAQPIRTPDHRLSGLLGGGESAGRLPRLRSRRGALPRWRRARPLRRQVHGGDELTSILFLAVLAGVLLRRWAEARPSANPAVLAVIAFGMIVVTAVAGGGSLVLLVAVATARIADIALTDGTTRTSINATYRCCPLTISWRSRRASRAWACRSRSVSPA